MSNQTQKTLVLIVLAAVIGLAVYAVMRKLSEASQTTEESDESESSPTPKPNAFQCKEKEQVQLMDSEKCKWACSSYVTAPTEERCKACAGIVVSIACPQCPPLCKASLRVMERGTAPATPSMNQDSVPERSR